MPARKMEMSRKTGPRTSRIRGWVCQPENCLTLCFALQQRGSGTGWLHQGKKEGHAVTAVDAPLRMKPERSQTSGEKHVFRLSGGLDMGLQTRQEMRNWEGRGSYSKPSLLYRSLKYCRPNKYRERGGGQGSEA